LTATLPSSPAGSAAYTSRAATGGGALDALCALRILDLSDGIAGAYCTKLLADAGAEVVKLEPSGGHPLRHWSVSGSVRRDGDADGALFRHLAAGQRSEIADLDSTRGRERTLELVAASDMVVESLPSRFLGDRVLGFEELHEANPTMTMVSITSFGHDGPRHADRRSEFLLQAIVGSLRLHGGLDGPPVAVGAAWANGQPGRMRRLGH